MEGKRVAAVKLNCSKECKEKGLRRLLQAGGGGRRGLAGVMRKKTEAGGVKGNITHLWLFLLYSFDPEEKTGGGAEHLKLLFGCDEDERD